MGLKIKVLGWVIGRRRMTIQPSSAGLAKTIILKPIDGAGTAEKKESAIGKRHRIHAFRPA
jgi:hypothetical protein